MATPLVRAARGTLASNIFAGDTTLGPTGSAAFAGMHWFADQSPVRLGPNRSRTYSGFGAFHGTQWSEFVPPLRVPAPVPAGVNPPKTFAFGSPAPSVADVLAKRNALAARLSVFPGYRVLTQSEAQAAVDAAFQFNASHSVGTTAFLASSKSTDVVPEELAYQLPQADAQALILAYLFYASAGSGIYEDGTADKMVASGEWSQSFVDGDLKTRNSILEAMAAWDVDGVIDRVFGTHATDGLGNPLLIGAVVVVLGLIAAGAYYLIETTNFAKEQDTRHKFQQTQCELAVSSGDKVLLDACARAAAMPPTMAESQGSTATKVAAIAAGALLAYAFVVYGLPHLLGEYHKPERGWF